ncbi:hypothetical protein GPALN_012704 [Globodera pallida]|nr:hypothetical protein GPALN_012704 [Globodera pallida]
MPEGKNKGVPTLVVGGGECRGGEAAEQSLPPPGPPGFRCHASATFSPVPFTHYASRIDECRCEGSQVFTCQLSPPTPFFRHPSLWRVFCAIFHFCSHRRASSMVNV